LAGGRALLASRISTSACANGAEGGGPAIHVLLTIIPSITKNRSFRAAHERLSLLTMIHDNYALS
jgi:hypothetical protein